MSGGAYDYAHFKIEELADDIRDKGGCESLCASVILRRKFKEHLRVVARALRAIEWNDSGDGDDKEPWLIERCLHAPRERVELFQLLKDIPPLAEALIAAIRATQPDT